MKQFIIIMITLTVSTFCYANGSLSNKLGAAWKSQQSLPVKDIKNDLTIVYGGADISAKPSTTLSTTLA